MAISINGLKRPVRELYLAGSSVLTRKLLAGCSGARRFDRIVIVAAFDKQNGITRGALLQYQALRAAGVSVECVDATPALRNPMFRARHVPGTAYIFHSGGPQTGSLISAVLPAAKHAWRIGYWAWELPDPPDDWGGCDGNIDEIWTPSRFSCASLARLVRKPIMVAPHHVPPEPMRRRSAGAPFTVLAMADSRSSFERKNPAGAVNAFATAFGDAAEARLILKLSGRDAEVEVLAASLGDRLRAPNIEVVRGYLDDAGLSGLYNRTDALLSLHRAEGFGLPMLEALARGIPIVATAWSGNVDFADEHNGIPVPYTLVPVRDAAGVYRGSKWAEPDCAAAAAGLRRLADDATLYSRLAAAAHASVAKRQPSFPLEAIGRAEAMTG